MSEWISVNDKLPEEKNGEVLAYMPDTFPYNQKQPYSLCEINSRIIFAMRSEHTKKWHTTNGGVLNVTPTHWMPLPEPPKEKSDG